MKQATSLTSYRLTPRPPSCLNDLVTKPPFFHGQPVEPREIIEILQLTNRFHVAVRLFSNRSQMTSKCGKNKKVAHEAIAECVTDVLTTF